MVISGPVWVEDATRAFVPARVVSTAARKVTIAYEDGAEPAEPGKVEFEEAQVYPRVEGMTTGVPEMDDLRMLNKATVLDNIETLFQTPPCVHPGEGVSSVYSCVGPVLCAMNPFQRLSIYSDEWAQAYRRAGGDPTTSRRLGPHAFRTAEQALQGLSRSAVQSIVICGESGAGKTVTNTKMLQYICNVAKPTGSDARGQVGADPNAITMTNQLLEAFGNATTTRNDNSSRFGKLTMLKFTDTEPHCVAGCGVKQYLLERSRITGAPENERNYHIFYQLLRSDDAAKYGLEPNPTAYEYTKLGAGVTQPGVYTPDSQNQPNDDRADFMEMCARLEKAGFDEESKDLILECMAAVLNFGNVRVAGDKDSSSVDPNDVFLGHACRLLGIDPATLATAVTTKETVVQGNVISNPVGKAQAKSNLDTVAKMVYSNVFEHIVTMIDQNMTSGSASTKKHAVGLLDIFGFEDMASNGFEQMFINLTNERIQLLFNHIVFEKQKEVYRDDGIVELDWLVGPSNHRCVELFLGNDTARPKSPGIVGYLSSQIKTGLDDDKIDGPNFVRFLNRNITRNEYYKACSPMELNKLLKKKGIVTKKGGQQSVHYEECFIIEHYAGQVLYTVQDFVPKSKEALLPHLGKAMRTSTKGQIQGYFSEDAETRETVGEKFKTQLKALAETLTSGETLFVRCIKSNQRKVPGIVDRVSVFEQLVRGGCIAALEMRAAGLPEKMAHKEFLLEFGLLQNETKGQAKKGQTSSKMPTMTMSTGPKTSDKKRVERILLDYCPDVSTTHEWMIGNQYVFMKSHVVTFLQAVRKFRIMFFTRLMQGKLASNRLRKVDGAVEAIASAEQLAMERGLSGLALVQDALRTARDEVRPVQDALAKSRAKHGSGKDQQPNVLKDMEPYDAVIKRIRQTANIPVDAVEVIFNRKQAVEGAFARKLSKVLQENQCLQQTLEAAEAECENCKDVAEPAEWEAFQQAFTLAKSGVLRLSQETIPSMKAAGPNDVDLEEGLTLENLVALGRRDREEAWLMKVESSGAFQVDSLLSDVSEKVAAVKDLGEKVLKVRAEFLQTVAELDERRTAASSKLEGLQGPAQRCMLAGLQGPLQCMSKAVDLDGELTRLEGQAKEPDRYREICAEFEEAVATAEAAVEEGKEELRRREEEERQRQKIRRQLQDVTEKINSGMTDLSAHKNSCSEVVVNARDTITNLQREAGRLTTDEDKNINTFQEKVRELGVQVEDTLDGLFEQINAELAARRENFKLKAAAFGGVVDRKNAATRERASVATAPTEDENDPEVYIRNNRLDEHKQVLLDLDQCLQACKDDGVGRSHVKKFVDIRFPAPGSAFRG